MGGRVLLQRAAANADPSATGGFVVAYPHTFIPVVQDECRMRPGNFVLAIEFPEILRCTTSTTGGTTWGKATRCVRYFNQAASGALARCKVQRHANAKGRLCGSVYLGAGRLQVCWGVARHIELHPDVPCHDPCQTSPRSL